jgi:hypothetical protein
MTEGMGVEGQGAPAGEEVDGSQQVSNPAGSEASNPAWNELLGLIPQELHSQVTPHLQKWDSNFDKVQSQYAPYKQFVDAEVPADNIAYALNAMQQLDQDPKQFYDMLTNYMQEQGLLEAQNPEAETPGGQGPVDGEELPEVFQHPEFQRIQKELQEAKQLAETLGQNFLQTQQQQQEAAEDEALQEQVDTLTEELGEFDVKWVLHAALDAAESGQDVEDLRPFVEQYRQYEQSIIEKSKKPAPTMMPSGGVAPPTQINMAEMSDKERREYIVSRLNAAKQA